MKSKEERAYHFIGIGGIGMSALARILLEKQYNVSGSDLFSNSNIEDLIQKGAAVKVGHCAAHIPPKATVIYSSDIKQNNPEFQAALTLKCPLLHRSDLLSHLMNDYKTLAIAGTHGKTTVTSLLTSVLFQGGLDPTFAVGGMLNGTNGKLGKGDFFVAEADESDGTFLKYHPYGAIVTNVEPEHMEYFKTENRLHEAFATFMGQVRDPGCLFYCGDDPVLSRLSQGKGVSYGFSQKCDVHIREFRQQGWKGFFDFSFLGKDYQNVEIPLVGKHNVLNGAAVFALSLKLGLSEELIRSGLAAFPGVARRCQKRGEVREVLLLDDYAHHPTEVKKTLFAIKEAIQEKRLIVIFQPHRYSRVHAHLEAFGQCFTCADFVYVTDIYGAQEQPIAGVDAEAILKEIRKASTVPCAYLSKEGACEIIREKIRPHDVVVTMGAGDITHFHTDLIRALEKVPPKKYVVGLLFGGKSCEHEISLRSARFINASLNRELYQVKHFGIDKEGGWLIGQKALDVLETSSVVPTKESLPFLSQEVMREIQECDLFFPVLHGPFGEDGTMQGFFELTGKPYAGPGYRGAAICMDKVLTKKLVAEAGVPTPPYVAFGIWEWVRHPEKILKQIESLPFPVFVKPSHVGSSVGISKVEKKEDLAAAIDYAFRFDTALLVEKGVIGCRELEFAVMGNHAGYISVPSPGEKLAGGEFVDYEKKYGKNTVKTTLEAQLSEEILTQGKDLARRAYESTGNSGMTRVDFLLDAEGHFWFFEMNPIPGLQPLSLFPKIWNREGVPGDKLADRLVILGLERHREQERHLNPL